MRDTFSLVTVVFSVIMMILNVDVDGFTPGAPPVEELGGTRKNERGQTVAVWRIPQTWPRIYRSNLMPREEPASLYTYYHWIMENDDRDLLYEGETVQVTVYFRFEGTDGRIPFRCLDSFEFKWSTEKSNAFLELSKCWKSRRLEYVLEDAQKMIFPYLKKVLEEGYGISEEDVRERHVVGFYIGEGSREMHMKSHLNLVGQTSQHSFPPGLTGNYLVAQGEFRFARGRKRFWSMSKAA